MEMHLISPKSMSKIVAVNLELEASWNEKNFADWDTN